MGKIRYQVFVSSTYEDLIEERKQVTQAILEAHCIPCGMELFPASGKSQWEFIKNVINESDVYLVIIAGKYGSIPKNRKTSYTEMEFKYAKSINKPIIALIHNNIEDLPARKVEKTKESRELLQRFVAKAKTGRLVKYWQNQYDIKTAVVNALNEQKSDLKDCGWIRYSDTSPINDDHTSQELSFRNEKLTGQLNELTNINSDLVKQLENKTEANKLLSKEKRNLEKELKNKEIALEEAQREITLYKTTNTKELSEAKARINKLEKEIMSYKWSNDNRAQYNASNNSNTKASMYIDNSDFWIRFTNNFLRNKYTLKNGIWNFEMRKDLAKYMNDNLITFFSIYNDLQKWNSIVTKATVKKSQFSKLSAQDQINYVKGVSFNNLLSDKILQNKRTLQDKVDTFFPHYLFVLITQENDCKSSAVTDVVSEVKTNMNVICNRLVAYVI